MSSFQKIFESLNIGQVTIKNRIAMAPMNDFHQHFDGRDGILTQQCIEYYVERAKGEVGLIISMVFKTGEEVTRYREDGMLVWNIITKKSQEKYAELAKYIHSYGTKIFFQLSAGPGRVAKGSVIDEGFIPISASDNKAFFRPEITCREITEEEVEKIIKSFGKTAKIVASAGIDGIEIHGHEGYLIDQFTTPLWNRRKDKYGGDLKKRLSLPIEILKSIKAEVGEDYPVIYRYGSKHFLKDPLKSTTKMNEKEVGRDIDESIEMARLLEAAGYDCLHLDVGCYESAYWAHPPMYLPHGFSVGLTEKVKKAVDIPVIAVGKMDVPELVNNVLSQNKADMVAIGRGLLADPHWVKKIKEGEQKEIKPCIACHEGMYRTESIGQYLTCALNPYCGNETTLKITKSPNKKKVLIAGGGIAGMEIAGLLYKRGHKVLLYEKTNNLGGQLLPASAPDFKADVKRLLDYYLHQMENIDIKINFNKKVDREFVKHIDPDIVISATGANPIIPKIKGVEKQNVILCTDVYMDKKDTGSKVTVIGGGLEGCESALHLSRKGRSVTIVEMLPELDPDLHRANKAMLLDMLDENNVQIITGMEVTEITDEGIIAVDSESKNNEIESDTIVLAVGMQADKRLYNSLVGDSVTTYEIGDCKEPRKILDAVWEANMIGLNI
jgi:2-enoate reductase